MCFNVLTHYGCFHLLFTSARTTLECADKIHDGFVHEYTDARCADCLHDPPGNFKVRARKRLIKLFNMRCTGSDRALQALILWWYIYHSDEGHTCHAPYHCYGESPEMYFAYGRPEREVAAYMPNRLWRALQGLGDHEDEHFVPEGMEAVKWGKLPEGYMDDLRARAVNAEKKGEDEELSVPDLVHSNDGVGSEPGSYAGSLHLSEEVTPQEVSPQENVPEEKGNNEYQETCAI